MKKARGASKILKSDALYYDLRQREFGGRGLFGLGKTLLLEGGKAREDTRERRRRARGDGRTSPNGTIRRGRRTRRRDSSRGGSRGSRRLHGDMNVELAIGDGVVTRGEKFASDDGQGQAGAEGAFNERLINIHGRRGSVRGDSTHGGGR